MLGCTVYNLHHFTTVYIDGRAYSSSWPCFPKVTKVRWYMRHYGAPTPKRHYGYANTNKIVLLDKGKLRADQRAPKEKRVKTCDSYVDKHGVKRYKGNANLRPTQNLVVVECLYKLYGVLKCVWVLPNQPCYRIYFLWCIVYSQFACAFMCSKPKARKQCIGHILYRAIPLYSLTFCSQGFTPCRLPGMSSTSWRIWRLLQKDVLSHLRLCQIPWSCWSNGPWLIPGDGNFPLWRMYINTCVETAIWRSPKHGVGSYQTVLGRPTEIR